MLSSSSLPKRGRQIAPIAGQVLGKATAEVKTDYTGESPLADTLTDLCGQISMADVALMNTGGIRSPLEPGDVTYEGLFRCNSVQQPWRGDWAMKASNLLKALARSAEACGDFGALMQSGLKVEIQKDCNPASGKVGTDTNAKLMHVETLGGKVLLDAAVPPTAGDDPVPDGRHTRLPGCGRLRLRYAQGVPQIQDLGIIREAMKDLLARPPATFTPVMDGRWVVQSLQRIAAVIHPTN